MSSCGRRSCACDALDEALQALGYAAYVFDDRGTLVYASRSRRDSLPREVLDAARGDERSALDDRLFVMARGREEGARVVLEKVAGRESELHARVRRAGDRFKLTTRQREVLALIADGHSTRTIAAVLDCSHRTVECHVAAILEKAEVESRAALAAKLWRMA